MTKLIGILSLFFSLLSFADAVCYDCETAGWAKMRESCGRSIDSKESFVQCLQQYKWTETNKIETKKLLKEIGEGYIEIKGKDFSQKSSPNSFKVFRYMNWACDKNGQLYLLSELG